MQPLNPEIAELAAHLRADLRARGSADGERLEEYVAAAVQLTLHRLLPAAYDPTDIRWDKAHGRLLDHYFRCDDALQGQRSPDAVPRAATIRHPSPDPAAPTKSDLPPRFTTAGGPGPHHQTSSPAPAAPGPAAPPTQAITASHEQPAPPSCAERSAAPATTPRPRIAIIHPIRRDERDRPRTRPTLDGLRTARPAYVRWATCSISVVPRASPA